MKDNKIILRVYATYPTRRHVTIGALKDMDSIIVFHQLWKYDVGMRDTLGFAHEFVSNEVKIQ